MHNSTRALIHIVLFCSTFLVVYAQQSLYTDPQIVNYKKQLIEKGYGPEDLKELVVTHATYSKHNGLTHVYTQQYLDGLPIAGALSNYSFRAGYFYEGGNTLLQKAELKRKNKKQWLDPKEAILSIAKNMDWNWKAVEDRYDLVLSGINKQRSTSDQKAKIVVEKILITNKIDERLVNGYLVEWKPIDSSDNWLFYIDGVTGEVVKAVNLTKHCDFKKPHVNGPFKLHRHLNNQAHLTSGLQSGYKVYPWPLESPNHGEQQFIQNPEDEIASPFGWHDIDGRQGPDFTITRGNNVHAFQDTANTNQSVGDEPNGGTTLTFDFDHHKDLGPLFNVEADLTNLFYWNNLMHDWSYQFGFDEMSGNFQSNNYGRGGLGADHINAHALDGEGADNATFSSPQDGSEGVMQMFKWIVGSNVEITSPFELAGMYNNGIALFGPSINQVIEAQVSIVNDEIGVLTDACDVIQNASEVIGSIALIDRGTCHFSEKVVNAQDRGAVACIVCNNEANTNVINMSGGNFADQVQIPSVFLTKEDCDLIKAQINAGATVHMKLNNEIDEVSSSFDNGIVVHEYAHGISDRLTGGANNSSCLNNDEQAGEGWSDFFALVMTHSGANRGSDKRGIASYVLGQTIEGRGIRRYHYSTDMNINPQKMSHIRATNSPHAVGEIWTSVLWDLYWQLIDIYGYDPTWINKESGNYIAVQLVIDGLKMQPCNPSLLQARDAIIEADAINNSGVNYCLLWKAFARRGFGVDASSGLRDIRIDNTDGFSEPLSCSGKISIVKNIAPTVGQGEELDVIVSVVNGTKEVQQSIKVTDEIYPGFIITEMDDRLKVTDELLTLDLRSLGIGERLEFSYRIKANNISSTYFTFFEGFESNMDNLDVFTSGTNNWFQQNITKVNGDFSFNVNGEIGSYQSQLIIKNIGRLTGLKRPGLKFYQRYDNEAGIDGGVVEISIDDGFSWKPITEKEFLVNGYSDEITEDIFYRSVIRSYTGEETWHPVLVDLTNYSVDEILVRFRFIGQDLSRSNRSSGWFIDNVEILEIEELQSQTCVGSNAYQECIINSTYINSGSLSLPTQSEINRSGGLKVFPNPTNGVILVSFLKDENPVELRVIDLNGQIFYNQSFEDSNPVKNLSINLNSLSPGTYIVSISSANGSIQNRKFIKL